MDTGLVLAIKAIADALAGQEPTQNDSQLKNHNLSMRCQGIKPKFIG